MQPSKTWSDQASARHSPRISCNRLIFSDGPCTCQPASPSTECCRTLDEAAWALKTASLRVVLSHRSHSDQGMDAKMHFSLASAALALVHEIDSCRQIIYNATGQGVNSAVVQAVRCSLVDVSSPVHPMKKLQLSGFPIWVCLKMLCSPKPNGFADHYPYEKYG